VETKGDSQLDINAMALLSLKQRLIESQALFIDQISAMGYCWHCWGSVGAS